MPKKFDIKINGELQPPKKIDFTVMGLDYHTNDFLNWCMANRGNIEFIKKCQTLEKASMSSVLHIDHLKRIQKIEDTISYKRN